MTLLLAETLVPVQTPLAHTPSLVLICLKREMKGEYEGNRMYTFTILFIWVVYSGRGARTRQVDSNKPDDADASR